MTRHITQYKWEFWMQSKKRKFILIVFLFCLVLITINARGFFKKLFSSEQNNILNGFHNAVSNIGKQTVDEVNLSQFHLWMKTMNLRMSRRRKNLQQKCKQIKLDIRGADLLHKPNSREFLVNRSFRLVWCNIFKAASTSWLHNFNILAGYTEAMLQGSGEQPITLARKKYPRQTIKSLEAALNDSTSFLIVRHPFDRLVSFFRNKVESMDQYYYMTIHYLSKLQSFDNQDLIKNHTFLKTFKNHDTKNLTFSEFVQLIIHSYQTRKLLDPHWCPITIFCTPCQVKLDIIIKFETLEEDQNYLIYKQNLQNMIRSQWKNPSKGKFTSVHNYYKKLNASQLYQLSNLYKYDFYLFDYKIDEYINHLAKNDRKNIIDNMKQIHQ